MSNWNNMQQWEVVLPPSRPTILELQRIKEYISEIERTAPVAILGSTPEFRELLSRMGFINVFVFDKSAEFNELMTNLIPNRAIIKERFILGDWINTISQFKNTFRIVLSDLTMGNIAYSDRNIFYQNIYDCLIKHGTFIDKVLAFDFEVPTVQVLFEKYENLPVNLRTINDFSSEVLFCSEFVTKENIVDSTRFYDLIRSGNYSEKIKHFAEKAHMITPEGFVWFYGKPWDQLEKDYYREYSQIIIYPEDEIDSPYYKRTKQIFSVK